MKVFNALILGNAGLPMISLQFPVMLVLFIPIWFLETWLIRRTTGIPWKMVLHGTLTGNGLSTIVGIPIAWALMFGLQIGSWTLPKIAPLCGLEWHPSQVVSVILNAAWLMPTASDIPWQGPVAALVLLVPSFYISWKMETWMFL